MAKRAKQRLYAAAPITEAVVELRYADAVESSQLKKLAKKLAGSYPNELVQTVRGVHVDFETGSASFTDQGNQVRLSSADEVDIVVLKSTAFSFSRLAPYTSWSSFRSDIKRNMQVLEKAGKRRALQRIGMRYINRIDIPLIDDKVEHEDYLNVYVKVPQIVESIDNYGLRFAAPFGDYRINVRSGSLAPEVPGTLAFLLDIDLMLEQNLPQNAEDFLEKLDEMREKKNDIFEAFIKPKARTLFDA